MIGCVRRRPRTLWNGRMLGKRRGRMICPRQRRRMLTSPLRSATFPQIIFPQSAFDVAESGWT